MGERKKGLSRVGRREGRGGAGIDWGRRDEEGETGGQKKEREREIETVRKIRHEI